jgi:5-formyltetrahydrofolate cyclo-ligase
MAPKSLDGVGPGPEGQKEALRRSMRRVREAIPAAERARLVDLVEEALFGLTEMQGARTVMLFYSFGTEVPTGGMTQRVLSARKRLLLPFLATDGSMEAAEIRPGEDPEPTEYGPREPPRRVAVDPADVDLVVAPGLAFDRAGNRLGYGGGYYDRYLGRMGAAATRVGVAFSLQLVDTIPTEPGDERVDIVVTDQGALDVRPVQ